MKIKSLLCAFLAVVALAACKREEPVVEPVLEVSSAELKFAAVSDEKVIYISANNDWSLETDVNWISFNQESGTASEEKQMVKVYADDNKVQETRSGKITITSGKLTHTINVTQAAAEPEPEPEPEPEVPVELTVSVTELTAFAEGGDLTFTVTSNKAWTASVEAAWVTLEPASGEASEETVIVKAAVAVNEAYEERTAVVTVTAEDAQKTVTITQAAAQQPEEPAEMQGAGTEADPYQIRTAEHLVQMRDKAILGGETWFKMVADIDMTGIENYVPANWDQNFLRKIHFDGCGHTISNFFCQKMPDTKYPSIFGVLYGSCRNLNIDNANVISTSGCGILGGYVGTTGLPAVVENVKITNSIVTNAGDRAGGVCGTAKEATFRNVSFHGTVTSTYADQAKSSCFAGQVETSVVFENCHATADFSSKGQYVGGLIGYLHENATEGVTMTGCSYNGKIVAQGAYVGGLVGVTKAKFTLSQTYSAGEVNAVGNYVGGLIGASMNDGVTITNCYSTANVTAFGQQAGGLVGTTTNKIVISDCFASGDVYSATSGAAGIVGRVQKSSSITNCIAWNKNVASSRSANNVYASGAILGCAQEKGTYKGCIRRADMVYVDDFLTLVDHEDCENACPPLPSYATATHQQAYHGKAAAAGVSLASVAKSLGWDESVWDFSSDSGLSIKGLGDNKIEF